MSIQSEIDRLNATKQSIKNAIISKGQSVADTDTFASYADKIRAIDTLNTGTDDATAAAGDILSGKTAYVKGAKVTGNITSKAAQTYTPGTEEQIIAAGQYLSGKQTIAGDANLLPENIVEGKSIFGKSGTAEPASALADELSTQDTLIADIMTALEGKTAGGGSSDMVTITTNTDLRYFNADGQFVSAAGGTFEAYRGIVFEEMALSLASSSGDYITQFVGMYTMYICKGSECTLTFNTSFD